MNVLDETLWAIVSDTLQSFIAHSNQFTMMADLALQPNLQRIDISNNHLETIPHLLDLVPLVWLNLEIEVIVTLINLQKNIRKWLPYVIKFMIWMLYAYIICVLCM